MKGASISNTIIARTNFTISQTQMVGGKEQINLRVTEIHIQHQDLSGLGFSIGRDETSRLRPTRRPWSSLRNLKCSSAGTTLIWYSSSSVVGPSPTPPSAPPPLPELAAIEANKSKGLPRSFSLSLSRRWIWAARRRPGLTGRARWNGAAGPRHPAVIQLGVLGIFTSHPQQL